MVELGILSAVMLASGIAFIVYWAIRSKKVIGRIARPDITSRTYYNAPKHIKDNYFEFIKTGVRISSFRYIDEESFLQTLGYIEPTCWGLFSIEKRGMDFSIISPYKSVSTVMGEFKIIGDYFMFKMNHPYSFTKSTSYLLRKIKGIECYKSKITAEELHYVSVPDNSNKKSVVGSAVVGGIIAGGAGAVVGAISAADNNRAHANDTTINTYTTDVQGTRLIVKIICDDYSSITGFIDHYFEEETYNYFLELSEKFNS